MAIDMSQFHQVFFEESFEGLEIMESGLLDMDHGVVDSEEINAIFRAAHSIKGGSGTFGFSEVASYTHAVETLLDAMRNGTYEVSQEAVTALLESVDLIRNLLVAARDGAEVDMLMVKEKSDDLREILNNSNNAQTMPAATPEPSPASTPEPSPASTPEPSPASTLESLPAGTPEQPPASTSEPLATSKKVGWHIVFRPLAHLSRTGNDPLRIIRELGGLGDLQVEVDISAIPELSIMEPESCYLSWDLRLTGDIPQAAVDDVFDWVEDDCDLVVMPTYSEEEKQEPEPVAVDVVQPLEPPVVEQPVVERRKDGRRKANRRTPLDRRDSDRRAGQVAVGSSSIRVDVEKVDSLINMVGELVITQSMLSMMGEDFTIDRVDRLKDGLDQLERHTRDLQESVMQIRMLPISFAFNRFPRMVHDLGIELGKQVELKMSGENTEVDKSVIEKIGDPLVHLVRNSLDHGIETPEQRQAAGKPETARVELIAQHRGGNIIVEIRDDGSGLDTERILEKAEERGLITEEQGLSDKQIYELIFQPGFSTVDAVSDLSGRGVGMDVVRRNIYELGGSIGIDSEKGVGTVFTIRLPLTLAILDGQVISVGGDTYIMPLVSIVESFQMRPEMLNMVAGRGETVRLRGEYIPIIRLHEIFKIEDPKTVDLCSGLLMVVEGEGRHCGLFVDDLIGQQQVVVKSLESNYQQVDGISGATILGDGSVALILDVPGIFHLARGSGTTAMAEDMPMELSENEVVGSGKHV
ncbi:MAG: chemotaxis protein CheA [Gammaproteobacteria bacterium]|nr:chemotaxis protein CheA [Gammaproteobacteria bacterium]